MFSFSQEVKKIEYKADILFVNEILGPQVRILKENVIFYHDSSTMYCDSAYYNQKNNYFDAFGHIQMIRPTATDTVYLYGDTLHYSGDDKLAQVRGNVRLIKDSLVLITENLDYDMADNIGYYFEGGTVLNNEDTLVSKLGYFYSNDDEFFFKDSVIVTNPRFKVFSDTLKHNTVSQTSYFLGQTEMISDSNYIYCENGWYNHEEDIAQFEKNAFMQSKEHTLKGDSLYYDRDLGIGKAFKNVELKDTVQDILLLGDYGIYNEITEHSLMTGRALFIQVPENKDSLYLHADTLSANTDSVLTDTSYRKYKVIRAYQKVKMYKSDFQLKCDSLVYSFQDSVIELFNDPVIWSDESQLTADFILVETKNEMVDRVYLYENALMVSESDSVRYNQIAGKDMVGYVANNELEQIDVTDNGRLVYYIKDDYGGLIGSNTVTSTSMKIYLKKQEVDKIWFYEKPVAKLLPPLKISAEDSKLDIFKWLINHRPASKEDVFIWEEEASEKVD